MSSDFVIVNTDGVVLKNSANNIDIGVKLSDKKIGKSEGVVPVYTLTSSMAPKYSEVQL
jgi:hypothetical protein